MVIKTKKIVRPPRVRVDKKGDMFIVKSKVNGKTKTIPIISTLNIDQVKQIIIRNATVTRTRKAARSARRRRRKNDNKTDRFNITGSKTLQDLILAKRKLLPITFPSNILFPQVTDIEELKRLEFRLQPTITNLVKSTVNKRLDIKDKQDKSDLTKQIFESLPQKKQKSAIKIESVEQRSNIDNFSKKELKRLSSAFEIATNKKTKAQLIEDLQKTDITEDNIKDLQSGLILPETLGIQLGNQRETSGISKEEIDKFESTGQELGGSSDIAGISFDNPKKVDEKKLRDALNADEINKIMDLYTGGSCGFQGAILPSQIKKLSPLGHMSFILLIGIDRSRKVGEIGHWVAINFDVDTLTVEFFDSFANDIPDWLLKDLKNISDKISPDVMLKVKVNLRREQRADSLLCGFHCIKFLLDRMDGQDFPEASGFSIVAKKHKRIRDFADKNIKFDTYV